MKPTRASHGSVVKWIAVVPFVLPAIFLSLLGCAAHPQLANTTLPSPSTFSPNGKLSIRFQLNSPRDPGMPSYGVYTGNTPLLVDSALGLAFKDTGPLAGPFNLLNVVESSFDTRYEMPIPTRNRSIHSRYNQTRVELEERAAPHRRLTLEFRAYDDGVAFRYLIPPQSGSAASEFTLTDEPSSFHFNGDPAVHMLPVKSFTTPYETYYETTSISRIAQGTLIALPLLLEFKNGPWMAISEADLTDYAGMYLTPAKPAPTTLPATATAAPNESMTLVASLSPLPGQTQVKVVASAPHVTPWRVMLIADHPEHFLESNVIVDLNPPSAIQDTTWIHPGKIAFPWWNGYMVPNQPFKGGVNTETMKYYIDFCAENGIEFHSIDGFDVAWYGGTCTPYQGNDITKAIPALDMPEVLAYARKKGVRTRLWMHWAGLKKQMDDALATYEKWGIDGIMIDFMDRDDQEMVNFCHEVLAKAAAHHLSVNFHGTYKPTGLQRTYPNLLNCEAVLNEEYNKWSQGDTPEHQLTVAFTRLLAGPMDVHAGGFRSVRPADFKPQNIAPLVWGSRAHQLAMYVVYENPLPMLSDDPYAYRGQPELKFLQQIPTTWDETRALAGEVGGYIIVARRHGNAWYVGTMNALKPRDLQIPLTFLGEGEFDAEIYADADEPTLTARSTRVVRAQDNLQMKLNEAGGQVIRLKPRKDRPANHP